MSWRRGIKKTPLSLRDPLILSSSEHSSPFPIFFPSSLAAPQISANLEQVGPHLKDRTPCPLYCYFGRLSAMPACLSVWEIKRGQKGPREIKYALFLQLFWQRFDLSNSLKFLFFTKLSLWQCFIFIYNMVMLTSHWPAIDFTCLEAILSFD